MLRHKSKNPRVDLEVQIPTGHGPGQMLDTIASFARVQEWIELTANVGWTDTPIDLASMKHVAPGSRHDGIGFDLKLTLAQATRSGAGRKLNELYAKLKREGLEYEPWPRWKIGRAFEVEPGLAAQIRNRYIKGERIRDLAADLDMGYNAVRLVVQGTRRRQAGPSTRQMTGDDVSEARELRSRGWSYSALSRRYKVSDNALRKCVRGETYPEVGEPLSREEDDAIHDRYKGKWPNPRP